MNEWDVILALVVVIDLFLTVYNPMSKNTKENTKAMTELNITMKTTNQRLENFEKQLAELETKNHDSHRRIWDHIDEQDVRIQDHESRIKILELEKEI